MSEIKADPIRVKPNIARHSYSTNKFFRKNFLKNKSKSQTPPRVLICESPYLRQFTVSLEKSNKLTFVRYSKVSPIRRTSESTTSILGRPRILIGECFFPWQKVFLGTLSVPRILIGGCPYRWDFTVCLPKLILSTKFRSVEVSHFWLLKKSQNFQ